MLIIIYSAAVAFLSIYFGINYIYIGFILILNLVILYLFGSYVLRAVIFPYSNFFVKSYLDSLLN